MKNEKFPTNQVYQVVFYEHQSFCHILEDLEIPRNIIKFYANYLQRGDYLLVIKSTELQLGWVKSVLKYLGIKYWEVFDTPETHHLISSSFDKILSFHNAAYSII
ncbi:MAG: hypothetical protein AAF915_26700 [Cyanobacteria bacterium P01_D01_bin.50]